MDGSAEELTSIDVGGRKIHDAIGLVRRYCELGSTRSDQRLTAWNAYDLAPTGDPSSITSRDLQAARAVCSQTARTSLDSLDERLRVDLSDWLTVLPADVVLGDSSTWVVDHLCTLGDVIDPALLEPVSKVLHRKRPHLIPLFDDNVVDWYGIAQHPDRHTAWTRLADAVCSEARDERRRLLLSIALQPIEKAIKLPSPCDDRMPRLSHLRAADIAVWMAAHAARQAPDPAGAP